MSSLFGTLNLGARALQTHSQGLAVAGQNLANVNNSAYTRQRLVVQTSATQESPIGPQGTGVTAVAIERIHNAILDRQIQAESSVGGFWNAQQASLASAQTELGERIDSNTQTAGGTSASAGVGAQSTLASDLSGLFSEFQTLPATPASRTQRAILLNQATNLATQFNLTDRRLGDLDTSLNKAFGNEVDNANQLLQSIAHPTVPQSKSLEQVGHFADRQWHPQDPIGPIRTQADRLALRQFATSLDHRPCTATA